MKYTQEQLMQRLNEVFGKSGAFYRDTTLSNEILEMYKVNIIFQEPTFCDATFKRSGMLASHRYQIISSNARSLDIFSENPQWGHCVWQTGRYFKVIDKTSIGEYTQITLLEIPEDLLLYFQTDLLAFIEKEFALQAVKDFEEVVNLPPLHELNVRDWLDRVVDPLGINDELEFFKSL